MPVCVAVRKMLDADAETGLEVKAEEKGREPPDDATPLTTLNTASLKDVIFVHPVGALVCLNNALVPTLTPPIFDIDALKVPEVPLAIGNTSVLAGTAEGLVLIILSGIILFMIN